MLILDLDLDEVDLDEIELPVNTGSGIKYRETVDPGELGCYRCPYLQECREDVLERDGFAWCEDLIPEDFAPQSGRAR